MSNQDQKEIDRVKAICTASTMVFVALIVGMTYFVAKQRVEETAKVKPFQQQEMRVKAIPAAMNK